MVTINTGAYKALIVVGRHCYPLAWSGHTVSLLLDAADIVLDGQTVGKGISLYSQTDLHRIMGKSSHRFQKF